MALACFFFAPIVYVLFFTIGAVLGGVAGMVSFLERNIMGCPKAIKCLILFISCPIGGVIGLVVGLLLGVLILPFALLAYIVCFCYALRLGIEKLRLLCGLRT